jgi:hypothetical protein
LISKTIKQSRNNACTPEGFRAWFHVYQTAIRKYKVRPSDIYNIDETGFHMGDTVRTWVIVDKMQGYTGYMPTDHGESLTVIECGSADGTFLPPFIIFKGKNFQST